MARCDEKTIKRIKKTYKELGSLKKTAEKCGVCKQTVRKYVKIEKGGENSTAFSGEQDSTKNKAKEKAKSFSPKEEMLDFCEMSIGRMREILPETKNLKDIAGTVLQVLDRYSTEEQEAERKTGYELPAEVIAPPFLAVYRAMKNEGFAEYELCGGRGAAKSSFISLALIWILMNYPDMHVLIVRKVAATLRDSVFAQMGWAIDTLGFSGEFEIKHSPLEISRTKTGQKIYFRGTDDPIKLKSIKPKFGFIGALWFEELDQFFGAEEIRSVRQSVLRGGEKAFVFKSYNPPKSASNWVIRDQITPKKNRLVVKSTYLDVPQEWIGKPFIEEAEFIKTVNPTAYEHEYLGVSNGNGGGVFENVKIQTISDAEIRTFDHVYNGLDWGYYPDPWAFNRMHFDSARRRLFIFAEKSARKKGNRETFEMLREMGIGNELITADSAEPKSIADYRDWGLCCRGANKGPGSVAYSMKWLQGLTEIIIDGERCPDTAAEFLAYEYERTKDGEVIACFPDKDNHHIDAVRYAMESVWSRRGR